MPKLSQHKILPHNAESIFEIVLDIESYPQFLPWCIDAKIIKKISSNNQHAELFIGFKGITESYLSDVSFGNDSDGKKNSFWVEAIAIKGPFKNLINRWKISEISNSSCKVEFWLDFEFSSALLGKLLGGIFSSATTKMIQAFEDRAAKIQNLPR